MRAKIEVGFIALLMALGFALPLLNWLRSL